jgi:hypothetical protein
MIYDLVWSEIQDLSVFILHTRTYTGTIYIYMFGTPTKKFLTPPLAPSRSSATHLDTFFFYYTVDPR